jgi:hypothetical protein
MSKLNIFASVLSLAFVFIFANPIKNMQEILPGEIETSDLRFKTDELIVGLNLNKLGSLDPASLSANSLGETSLTALATQFGVKEITQVFPINLNRNQSGDDGSLQGIFIFKVKPGTNLRAMRAAFEANPYIEYTEYNRYLHATEFNPNDPQYPSQWALSNSGDHDIDANQAWQIQKGNSNILIAVIDTGVLYTHPDLKGARIRTDIDYDFSNNDNDAIDDNGHGTHVAGIIGANTNNGQGIAGVCMNCSILPVKVLDKTGSGSADNVAKGIVYAADKGARVINMSLGISPECGCSKTIAKAINYAFNKGVLLIAAAGNDGKSKIGYPASSPRVMAVGATDSLDRRTSWSNYGNGLDVVAPGNNILSTYLENSYKQLSGTSMATPHVVGIAGLVISGHPQYKNTQVWWVLRQSADDLGKRGYDTVYGSGRVNAFRAVKVISPRNYQVLVDKCNREPESGCGDCSLSMVADQSADFTQNLQTLYRFRDNVLSSTPTGKRWISYFNTHTLEVSGLLYANPDIKKQAANVLTLWMPSIRILAEGSNTPYLISPRQIDALRQLRDAFIAHGSNELAGDLLKEWERLNIDQLSNQEVHSIWNLVNKQK